MPEAERPVNQSVKPCCLRSWLRSERERDGCQVMFLCICIKFVSYLPVRMLLSTLIHLHRLLPHMQLWVVHKDRFEKMASGCRATSRFYNGLSWRRRETIIFTWRVKASTRIEESGTAFIRDISSLNLIFGDDAMRRHPVGVASGSGGGAQMRCRNKTGL